MPQRVDDHHHKQQRQEKSVWNTIWVTHFDLYKAKLIFRHLETSNSYPFQQVPEEIAEISQIQQMCEF